MRADSSDYQKIICQQRPLIDLRSPIEFSRGAFPNSLNLPLMSDDERHSVGTCYKQKGQQAAILLGNELVSGDVRDRRMQLWQQNIRDNEQGYMYCFRGGLRSKTVQKWLADSGIHYPLVEGGYKSIRQYLMQALEKLAQHPLLIIAGNTGNGKTKFINKFQSSIDLEGAARHRGSSFGAMVDEQASQIEFENTLAAQYVCGEFSSNDLLCVEDEGRTIGSVHLPITLKQKMTQSSLVVIEQPFDYRIEQIFNEYVIQMSASFCEKYGLNEGFVAFSRYLEKGLFNVRRRLGSQRYQTLNKYLTDALTSQLSGNMQKHYDWLVPLIQDYYDPMYQYQLKQKQDKIVFRGNWQDCSLFVETQLSSS